MRIAGQSEKQTEVLLDFRGDQTLAQSYWNGPWPVTIIGSVSGTRTVTVVPPTACGYVPPQARRAEELHKDEVHV